MSDVPLLDHGSLPDVASARLPQRYEAAKVALAECVRIDECQDWADRMEAMASYARQRDDPEMRAYCDRIQARAVRRGGQIYQEIASTRGRNQHSEDGEGTLPKLGQVGEASRVGIGEWRRKTMLRVARVPEEEFEAAVEADEPATVSELAERGKKRKEVDAGYLNGRDPDDFKAATPFMGMPREFMLRAEEVDLARVNRGLNEKERAEARANYQRVVEWIVEAWRVLDGLQSR